MWGQLIIGSFFYKKKQIENPLYIPKVSVIIPAWNEQTGIKRTVQSIVENGYPNYEVIVVNDGSTDRTADMVASL